MPADARGRSLYICYFGMREPLVQTQVLPYLRQLAAAGFEIFLLTFEPDTNFPWQGASPEVEHEDLSNQGIHWFSLPYHKRPSLPATLYDIACGARFGCGLVRRHGIQIVHGRAHVGAAIGALIKRYTRARLLFDIRGFNPEEYVDAGIWSKNGLKFRLAKAAEKRILAMSDGFVLLTDKAKKILFPGCDDSDGLGRPISVIPTCVDLQRFRSDTRTRKQIRDELRLSGRDVYVYVGALGGFYLTEELARFFHFVYGQNGNAHALVLTQSDPTILLDQLKKMGYPSARCTITCVPPSEVPANLRASDVAVSFIKNSYSKQSSSPTKIAEYLAAGLPVVCNAGVGDVDAVIDEDRVGVLLDGFSTAALDDACVRLAELRQDPELADRCRRSAEERYDMGKVGGAQYIRQYEALLGYAADQRCVEAVHSMR